jgi:mRNA-degrading endonuclease RelE of RelBE toxin-antitoxin system
MRVQISKKASKQIKKLGLEKQFEKQKELFLSNPFHPSLDFKQLKGTNKGFYALRINDQYRARLVKLDEQTYFILVVGDFRTNPSITWITLPY